RARGAVWASVGLVVAPVRAKVSSQPHARTTVVERESRDGCGLDLRTPVEADGERAVRPSHCPQAVGERGVECGRAHRPMVPGHATIERPERGLERCGERRGLDQTKGWATGVGKCRKFKHSPERGGNEDCA